MYKLEIKLKQHTPLIHFQHEQKGATLRASEVKPRLDRYILTKLGGNDLIYQNALHSAQMKDPKVEEISKYQAGMHGAGNTMKWLIGKGDKPALDYKMRIEGEFKDEYLLTSYLQNDEKTKLNNRGQKYIAPSSIFGEMKYGVIYSSIIIQIQTIHSDLRNILENYLSDFFISHNFGLRQSKGFGSFTLIETKQDVFEESLCKIFKTVYRSDKKRDIKTSVYLMDSTYKKLRSGTDHKKPNGNFKMYFRGKRPMVEWEKPVIQKEIGLITSKRMNIDLQSDNVQFTRALLGLPELYEYPEHDMAKVKVKSHSDIERYASPILFKIFDGYVYLIDNQSEFSDDMLDKEFGFEFTTKTGGMHEQRLSLRTPNQFTLSDFLKKAMKEESVWYDLKNPPPKREKKQLKKM